MGSKDLGNGVVKKIRPYWPILLLIASAIVAAVYFTSVSTSSSVKSVEITFEEKASKLWLFVTGDYTTHAPECMAYSKMFDELADTLGTKKAIRHEHCTFVMGGLTMWVPIPSKQVDNLAKAFTLEVANSWAIKNKMCSKGLTFSLVAAKDGNPSDTSNTHIKYQCDHKDEKLRLDSKVCTGCPKI